MSVERRQHPPVLQIGGWPLGQRPKPRTPQGGLRHDEDTRLSILGWHRTTTKDFDTGSTWTWHRDGCERRSQGWCVCGNPPLPEIVVVEILAMFPDGHTKRIGIDVDPSKIVDLSAADICTRYFEPAVHAVFKEGR